MQNEVAKRAQAITRTSVIGIIVNVIMAACKALIGILAGAVSIILDAVNNTTDALSSIITIAGIKLAQRRPDAKHPFGHGRIEYFSAIIIALIILFAGATSLIESVKKIFTPELPDIRWYTIIIVVMAVCGKFFLGRYVVGQGKRLNSDALTASGKDAQLDALVSTSTLLGALVALIFKFSIDGFVGVAISVLILKAGIEMLLEPISNVMGKRADSEITKSIKQSVREIPGVLGAYDLILHNYGPSSAIGSIHVEVDANVTARDIHHITKHVQLLCKEKYKVFMTVGIYAVDEKDPVIKQMRDNIKSLVTSESGVLGIHGIYIDTDSKIMSFDTVLDFSVSDKEAFRSLLKDKVLSEYPGYDLEINFDTNYSD